MTQSEARRKIAESFERFYVYILKRPDGTPFYVGKGMGGRCFDHERDALGYEKSYKLNIIRSVLRQGLSISYELDSFHRDEMSAHNREVELIRTIGRHDLGYGPLANLTDGGEGACNLSEASRQQHLDTLCSADAEGERGIANRFFAKLRTVRSVPIKPASEFKPLPLSPHPQSRQRTPRMAAALAASAIANRVMLEAGALLPRRMRLDGRVFFIENGVGRDILQARLAELVPATIAGDESFRLVQDSASYIVRAVGRGILLDAGVLMPEVSQAATTVE